jgi:hypothetical protein
MEIVKPTLFDKQIPTKAFLPFDLQHLGEVNFKSLSPNTISISARSLLLSFDGIRCFDSSGSLSPLSPHFSIFFCVHQKPHGQALTKVLMNAVVMAQMRHYTPNLITRQLQLRQNHLISTQFHQQPMLQPQHLSQVL